jgi:hypothetical protein
MTEFSPKAAHLFEYPHTVDSAIPSLITLDVDKFIGQVEEIKTKPVVNGEAISRIKDRLRGSKEIPDFHHKVLTRVAAEVPSIIEDFEELGIERDLFDEDLSGKKHGVDVEWESPAARQRCDGASYFPHSRKIELTHSQPDFLDRVLSIGTTGRMHISLLHYGHEFTHDLQYRGLPLSDATVPPKLPQLPTELKEAQAYLVSDSHLSIRELRDHIVYGKGKDGYEAYPGVEPLKLQSNLKLFKLLNAFGVSQPEIARLVRNPGPWDDSKHSYLHILQKSRDSMRGLDLTPGEIELRSDLLRTWNEARAKNVVYQELKGLVGEAVLKSS